MSVKQVKGWTQVSEKRWVKGATQKAQGDWITFADVPMGQTFSFGGELWRKVGDGMAEGVPSKNRRAFNPGTNVKEDES